MNKPNSLKTHLMATVPELKHNPNCIRVFMDEGTIRSTAAPGLSFEYSYTLNVILVDFPGHPDAVAIPLLAWLMVNQPELLENLERGKDAIRFEAEILDDSKVDLSIELPLTERVIVKPMEDGRLQVDHPAEPQIEETVDLSSLRLETSSGELIGVWGTP